MPSPEDLLEVCVAAARAAGAVLIDGLTRDKQVQLKSERSSIVTWADVTAQAEIFRVIGEHFPDHALLG
jgi:fructose-1,6-bisphosphatase/inositol monophosphatase family enzyme